MIPENVGISINNFSVFSFIKIHMKTFFLLLLVCFASLQTSFSQDKKIGIVGGANYSTFFGDLTDNENFNYSRRISFHVGLVAEFSLSQKFTFSPRITYSSQGYKSKSDDSVIFFNDLNGYNFVDSNPNQSMFEISEILNYINIPLLFKYSLGSRFHVNFGSQVGFLINGITKAKTTFPNGLEENDKLSGDGDFKLDYGGLLGVSYNLMEELFVELNYYEGFSNIYRGGLGDRTNNNSVFQLSTGYLLF